MTHNGFPTEGVALTHLLVVSDLDRSRQFYRDVLGATVYRDYGGTSCVLTFLWLVFGNALLVASFLGDNHEREHHTTPER
jgi:catechol 2,3-dioxygenase-like lactoylglutathione lyase family enzyme